MQERLGKVRALKYFPDVRVHFQLVCKPYYYYLEVANNACPGILQSPLETNCQDPKYRA